MTRRRRGTGLAERHVDPRNYAYGIGPQERRALAKRLERAYGLTPLKDPKAPRRHRHYWWGDQSPDGCTAWGSVTWRKTAPIASGAIDPALPATLLDEIKAIDRAEGRVYDAGATSLAAAKAMRARGWISEYRWLYTVDEMIDVVHNLQPVCAGTVWPNDWFTPNAEWIVRRRNPADTRLPELGHYYDVSEWDPRRALFGIGQTWGDARRWYIPADEMRWALEQAGGEVLVGVEVPLG